MCVVVVVVVVLEEFSVVTSIDFVGRTWMR